MKNKIKLLSIILLIAIQHSSYGQLKRAYHYFELYRFSKAIPIYQKVINKGSVTEQNEAIMRIADCYRLMNNSLEAKSWYLRAVENPIKTPSNYLYLGKALCELENYIDAKDAFEKYSQFIQNKTTGALYSGFCDWAIENKDFLTKVEIKNEKSINTQWSDFSPATYKDGIIFTSDRVMNYKTDIKYYWTNNDYLDLYTSTPKYYKDYWTDMDIPKPLDKNFSQMYHDGPIVFSKDGSKAIVSKTVGNKIKKGNKKYETHVVKLFYGENDGGKQIKFKPFFLNSDEYSVAHATLSTDANTMIFSSDMPGGKGKTDLYSCTWENETWTNFKNLGVNINSIGNEVFPFMVNDSILLFSSDGHAGFGGLDLYISYKKDTSWSKPINLMKPMNSSYDDFGILLFEDQKSGFLSSNRPGGEGLDDIYAFRNFEINIQINKTKIDTNPPSYIAGYVKDKTTLLPIDKATVYLYNPQTGKVKILKTNPDGFYKTEIVRPADFLVKAMQSNYIADCLPWDIEKIEKGTTNAPRDLLLNKLDLNKTFVLKNIYYDFDKYFIRPDAVQDLNNVINIMQDNPNIIAELSSHTDSRATFSYNNTLSQNRANAAVDYIVINGGIMPGRILARGYGEYKLTNNCSDGVNCSEENHQLNRRTEFKVIGYNKSTNRGQFDPSKFIDGEIIDIKSFPDNFFYPCDIDNILPKDNYNKKLLNFAPSNEKKPLIVSNNKTISKYKVKKGDTISSIAKKHKITIKKIMDFNKLLDDKIIIGQNLKLY